MSAPRRQAKLRSVRRPLFILMMILLGQSLTQACDRTLDGLACDCKGEECSCIPGWQCCAGHVCHLACQGPDDGVCEPVTSDGQSGQWCWASPHPHGRLLFDIWGLDPDDLWAAGEGGTLLHRQGGRWSAEASPTKDGIMQVWGTGRDDLWLVTDASLFHSQGNGWSPELNVPGSLDGSLRHIWGSTVDDVWAVTDNTALHRIGGQWTHVDFPADVTDLKAVWGSDRDHVWAVGRQILQWDGSTWSKVFDYEVCDNPALPWSEISGRGNDDVWVTNYAAQCTVHWDGHEWGRAPDTQKLRRLFAIHGTDNVGALNDKDELIAWDGNSWQPIMSLDDSAFAVKAVWADGADEIWSVGDGASIKHWQDGVSSNVSPFSAVTWANLNDVHGAGKDVWIVGDDGLILHYDGQTWNEEPRPTTTNLTSVWAQWSDKAWAAKVWAVGENGTILVRDAGRWVLSDQVDGKLTAVWASNPADAWAVGMSGAVYHFDGTGWQAVAKPTEQNLLDVWGTEKNDVWVVGGGIQRADGEARERVELFHWGGADWDQTASLLVSATDARLSAGEWRFCTEADRFSEPFGAVGIWGTSASNIWVTTRCGGTLRWGGTWELDGGSPNDRDARGIWSSSGSVWVVGNWGRISHFYDKSWHDASITGSSTPRLNAVWGSASGEVWAVGADGTILRHQLTSAESK